MENLDQALKLLRLTAENSALDSLSDSMKEGVSLDTQDEKGWTALHHASHLGNMHNIQTLLENGANPNIKNNDGQTALYLAAKLPEEVFTQVLLEKGARPDEQDNQGRTALHQACSEANTQTLKVLLDKGARADIRDVKGQTVMHLAAQQEVFKLLTSLQRRGLDLDTKDNQGLTALHHATQSKLYNNILVLLKCGAYVDPSNRDGETPIVVAVKIGFFDGARLLLMYGAFLDPRIERLKPRGLTFEEVILPPSNKSREEKRAEEEYIKQSSKIKYLQFPEDAVRVGNVAPRSSVGLLEVRDYWMRREVFELRSTKITEGFTLHDLATRCDKPDFLFDADLTQKLETLLDSQEFHRQFEEYEHILRTKFRRAKRNRFYLTQRALESVFSEKRQPWCDVTEDVWRHVFSFLFKDDLINFIRSGEDGK